MPRYDNYPDDIRNYDHDPRSPFHVEAPQQYCGGCRHYDYAAECCELDEKHYDDDTEACDNFEVDS